MKIGFYCFTGTGNTRRVCETLAEELRARGRETEINLIHYGNLLHYPEEYDALVFAFPVHAFNAPSAMLDFLKALPQNGGAEKSVWLVRVSGEPVGLNHASGILPKRILKRRGYTVKGECPYVMPYNIIFRHSNGMAARMWRAMRLLAQKHADMICENTGVLYKNGPFRRAVSFALRIEHTAMPIMGKTFKAGKECVGCGACEKLCPRGNISVRGGKVHFSDACVGCMACAFGCPHDAIRISLLNGWRVNGAYTFKEQPASDDEVCNYCKKAYLRYFHEAEGETAENEIYSFNKTPVS